MAARCAHALVASERPSIEERKRLWKEKHRFRNARDENARVSLYALVAAAKLGYETIQLFPGGTSATIAHIEYESAGIGAWAKFWSAHEGFYVP